ncbi:hypothetical protein A3B84_02795 [Candidatus Nomurabacteria bacterium RIFCSPHIGHO2_02_FULL_35_13]|uniref:Uncharacterized protein n=1 Tax=Candidatus Nomurabacteria bacterium RIFCSPHIGHO2_02_FULL_35_13 TaxID=1801748 RepID=A0A1F6VQ28_9BACT|nr:MAG: hypothetical protein A3B84_02795 [Candidatus Nomurabacteria bacterium RIFCSPHIGHO2_02_FULL_35_13]
MIKNIVWGIVVVILGILALSFNKKVPEVITTQTSPKIISQSIEEQCKNSNGKLTRGGLNDYVICIHTYSDAKKSCTSSNQCQSSYCVAIENNLNTGTCKVDDGPWGCDQTIEDARTGKEIECVD